VSVDAISRGVQSLADALFLPWLVVLLFGSGIFLTIRLRLVQIRRVRAALASFVGREDGSAGGILTPFQAFMTALAATIGTGNIAGVAAGIVSGGPGALFWIWCYGFVATAIKFSEAVLGVRFREVLPEGTLTGPMYYLRDGLRSRWLAAAYAFVAGLAALTTTPFTQTNSIALVWHVRSGVPTWVSGIVIGVLTWLVIIGGIRSIGRAAEKLTPLKVGLYLAGGATVLITFAGRIPEVLALVVRDAFSLRATAGGTLAIFVAMRYGLARGVYANEAGYGTAAVAYGTAMSREPQAQGLNAVVEVFIVSFVTSSISALSILLTGAYLSGQTSTAAVALAFDAALPGVGGWMVAVCVFLFGYTTLVGWSYYGEQFLVYLFGQRIVMPYRWVYCLLIPIGAVTRVDLVWAWGDLMNALQVFPNMFGVLALSGLVAAVANQPAPDDARARRDA
jgi:alanine or glycine:cation symporter, AGCS family